MSTRHFTMGMICTTQLRSSIILKNEKQSWEHVYQASYCQYQQNPFNKLNKINITHIQTSHFSNLNNNLKTKESMAINMKYFEKNRKPIPFLEFWRKDDDENGRFLRETRWVCERDERTRQWTVKVNEGKLKSFWNLSWKRPSLCKTCDFCDWNESQTSRQTKSQKNPWGKIWKICPSVFCNWKFHLQGSREGSHETF